MTKILGLDLGTNSIGWAVVDKDHNKILNAGVRIFPEGVVKETIGQGDKEISKNAERREHRQARRLNYRKRLRKIKLLQVLIENKMCPLTVSELNGWKNWDKSKKSAGKKFPDSIEFIDWLRMNPYILREKAINDKISLFEFGRILYHFIQRRGFLSSRKGGEDGAIFKGKENMEGIDNTRKLLDGKTLGQKMYEIMPKERETFKRIMDDTEKDIRIRARYTLREMYVDEFEKIWNKQADRLGLINIEVNSKKEVSINGTIDSKENKNKVLSLENKYGKSNIIIGPDKIIVKETKPFKEFIAGKIESSDEGIKFKSNESVLFWQRPLRSQKGLLGKCTFEKRMFFDKSTGKKITIGSTPSPVSQPEYELFRAYQFINNIRFGKNQVLNDSQREIVLDLINNNDKNFDFEKVVSALKMTYEFFNFEKDFKVPANPTHKRLKSYFTEEQWLNSKNDIWHCFYFYEDSEMLAEKLARNYGLSLEKSQRAAKQKIVDGYGSVSLKAIRNIIPFLEKGYQYSTAVILGGVKNAFGDRWDYFEDFHDEIINKVAKLINSKKFQEYEFINELKHLLADPENKYGFSLNDKSFRKLYHHSQGTEKRDTKNRLSDIENIRNPIVQRGLNEMRRLVNALIDKYSSESEYGEGFTFDRIHVEMGRELRSGKNQRKEMAFKLNLNEKANEEARMRVSEYGLKPSRDNIIRYRLFREIEEKHGHAICPYTNQTITLNNLLGGKNTFQIEHILPFSVSLDDSFNNKTLCESNFNRLKGELTPYEFYQKNNDPALWRARSWEEIERRAYSLLPFLKAKKFASKKRPQENDFIERQLNDTRYIAVKASSILKEICNDVRVMPGQLTAELRRLWGLNNIIQPVLPLNLDGYSIHEDESLPHFVVIDSNGIPRQIVPEMAEKPVSGENQIIIPGLYDGKKMFSPESKHQKVSFEIEANGLPKGKYWLKVNISEPLKFVRIYTEKPDGAEDRIIYRGLVSGKKFSNESLQRKIDADRIDGVYWAVFKVKKSTFVIPEKGKQPSISKSQVLLFGEIRENIFSSYIYSCETNMIDGKYWAVLDMEFENADFVTAFNKPNPEDGEFFLEGTVGDNGVFLADTDLEYQEQTQLVSGKYYAVVSVTSHEQLYPVKNDTPSLNKGESLVEGNVWVNKQTGEIMFDPKKNRDDHRHHAVDAITIALTELGYLQKLSHYFGEFKEKERGIGDRPVFAPPWMGFSVDVKKAVDNILVSYHRNDKVLSKISKRVTKSGKTYQSVGYAARGRLHREFYFGQHPSPVLHSNKNGNELKFERGKDGLPVYYYHIRKPVSSLKNNKHVNKIVDKGIRELIEKRLQEVYQINTLKDYTIPDGFFFDGNKHPSLYLNNKSGDPVPVRKARMKETIGKAVQLKDGINQWVNPYNNHHVVIYQGKDGRLNEQVVTFWEVIERIQQGEPIYKLPEDGEKLITTLQENEMFLIGLPQEITAENKYITMNVSEISQYLYRVQKLSSMYYTFRHHLASTVLKSEEEVSIRSISGWEEFNPLKVKIDLTGKIELY